LNRLDLLGGLLTVAFLAAAIWNVLISYTLQYGSLLLASLTPPVILFVGGVLWKRSGMVLYSWIWLAADFVVAQDLQGSEASVLGSVVSVVIFLVVIDLYQFLQRVRTSTVDGTVIGPDTSEESWFLLKRRSGRTLLTALVAGGIVVSGFAVGGSTLVSPDPLLVIAAVSFILLILTALLGSGNGRKT
jgi:hypothetical protein